MKQRMIIIDGNSLINRAFFALSKSNQNLNNKDGVPTNAIYGFLSMLYRILEDYKPDFMSVAFDMKGPTFRHEAFTDYKGTRKGMPDELRVQMPILKEILDAMGIHRTELSGFEADDLIGTIAKHFSSENIEVLIVTGDKDALQLVNDCTKVLITRQGITNIDVYDRAKVIEDFELTPEQIIDLKGLSGDTSDNIPGVPGVGPKTAVKLLSQFGTVEEVIQNTESIENKRIRGLIEEYAHQAMMSKRLATIEVNVPLDLKTDDFVIQPIQEEALIQLYKLYELKTFLKKVQIEEPIAMMQQGSVTVIREALELPIYVEKIKTFDKVALNLLYDKNTLREDQPAGLALTGLGEETYYFHFDSYDFKTFLTYYDFVWSDEQILKIGFDIKKEWIAATQYGVVPKNMAFDVLIAYYLLEPQKNKYSVDDAALQYLNVSLASEEHYLGKGVKGKKYNQLLCEEASLLATQFSLTLYRLYDVMMKELEDNDLMPLFRDVEMPLVEVLASMEYDGFTVDLTELEIMDQQLSEKLIEIEKDIYTYADEKFNINSPKQLGEILFEKLALPTGKKTKTGYSTGADVLDKLVGKHPIVPLILEYRTYAKLKSTYIDGLRLVVNPLTGKIHSSLNQTVAVTGRLSSTEPNLQNIPMRVPLGRRIRKIFVPSEGNVLIDADYSQIELRILAHYAQDENLLKAFREHMDIHTITASQVFNIKPEQVTSLERSRAKEVNFGIVYGMSDFGLAENLGIPRKTAKAYIESYFENYPGVRGFMDGKIQECRDSGYVTTLLGRKRYIPDIHSSNFNVRSFAERTAMNTPIQGSAADIIKIAMILVYKELKSNHYQSKLILQVHDELIIDAVPSELEAVQDLLKRNMEQAVQLLVPMEVGMSTGQSWYDSK